MRPTHTVSVFRRPAGLARNEYGEKERPLELAAAGIPCSIQLRRARSERQVQGTESTMEGKAYFPAFQVRDGDRLLVTRGPGPKRFRVSAPPNPRGARYETEAELVLSGETFGEEPAG